MHARFVDFYKEKEGLNSPKDDDTDASTIAVPINAPATCRVAWTDATCGRKARGGPHKTRMNHLHLTLYYMK